MQITALKLSELKPSELNVRKSPASKEEDAELEASIRSHGVIVPLAVRHNGGVGYEVIMGGRRLATLRKIHKGKESEIEVPVIVRASADSEATEISLVENLVRVGMHPVEEYEAFAILRNTMEPKEIGKKFGYSEKDVLQRLALGGLHKDIRDYWRASEDEDWNEVAMAFTLERDQARQKEIFDKLNKRGGMSDYSVKAAIVGNERDTAKYLRFVGIDTYKKAGGTTVEDLFADSDKDAVIATDAALLKKLADEKMNAKVEDLRKSWKWAELASDVSNSYYWETKGKDADKTKTGCIVDMNYNGQFDIRYGVVRPQDKRIAEKKKKEKKGEPTVAVSQNMANDLSRHMSGAVQSKVAQNFDLAYPLMLTSLWLSIAPDSHSSPVSVKADNRLEDKDPTTGQPVLGSLEVSTTIKVWAKKLPSDFCNCLRVIQKLPRAQQDKLCAALIAASIDTTINSHEADEKELALIFDFVKPEISKFWEPTGKSYFAHVPKGLSEQAIKETAPMSSDSAKIGVFKKAEAAAAAERCVKGKGWLPIELRTAAYKGPGKKRKAA